MNHTLTLATSLCMSVGLAFATDHGEAPKLDVAEGHEALKHEVGTWDAVQKIWMSPDAEPMVAKGIETNEMLGEYWLVSDFQCEMMGQPFRGRGQFGYNPTTKKYMGTWIDTMSFALNKLEGTMEGNALTMYSKGIDPMTGKEKTTKMVSTYPDANHKTFVAYDPVPGKEGEWQKTMEVVYTKRAATK